MVSRVKVGLLKSEQYLPPSQANIPPPNIGVTNENIQTIADVVNGLSRRTPWRSTCLVKVIAAHKMLLKRGVPHVLHFGVQKNSPGEIKAHAWLSTGTKIIVGGEDRDGYNEISRIAT